MKELHVIGISRGSRYSPHRTESDAAIFAKVTKELEKKGWIIDLFSEDEFLRQPAIHADVIYNMARSPETVSLLCKMEEAGTLIINSGYGIANCIHQPLTELLIKNGIPYPRSMIIPTDTPIAIDFYPCWLKRGDSHTVVKDDVCLATCPQEAQHILSEFYRRGIKTAVVNEHLMGDLIKFYGVRHTDFWDWYRFSASAHSKFDLEKINGEPTGYDFDVKVLKKWADKAARILNVHIYGGDGIIAADGTMKIIDFNDWPSFLHCREEGGIAIANCIAYLTEMKYNYESRS